MIIDWFSHPLLLSAQTALGVGFAYFLYSIYRDVRQAFFRQAKAS